MEGWQTQNTPYYPDQTCPDQPHQQQSFEPTSKEDHCANSVEWEIEGVNALQQNMQGCARSEGDIVMEMQHTYEEQQSDLDNMIRQVALLTVMIKEMQENRANPEEGSDNEEKEGVIVTAEGDQNYVEQETAAEVESGVMSQDDQGAEEPSVGKEGGDTIAGKTPHKSDRSIGYHVDGGNPKLREDESKKGAARTVNWVRLQPWPGPLKK